MIRPDRRRRTRHLLRLGRAGDDRLQPRQCPGHLRGRGHAPTALSSWRARGRGSQQCRASRGSDCPLQRVGRQPRHQLRRGRNRHGRDRPRHRLDGDHRRGDQQRGRDLRGGCYNGHYGLLRYSSAGVRSTSGFGTSGIATANFGGTSEAPTAIALTGTGTSTKILLVGTSTQSGTGEDFAAARFNYNGTLYTVSTQTARSRPTSRAMTTRPVRSSSSPMARS